MTCSIRRSLSIVKVHLCLTLFISAMTVTSAQAQRTAARPDRGMTAGGTYSVSDIESVNLQNGNVQLSIPLASLPPIAGGNLSCVIRAYYNSKLWNVTRREVQVPDIIDYQTYFIDQPQMSDRGGWSVGGCGYGIRFREAREDVDYLIPPYVHTTPDEWQRLQYQYWKAILITPDGAEHEMRPADPAATYDGFTRDYLRMYFRDTPLTRGTAMRYYTIDGTYISALIQPWGPPGSPVPRDWTLFMPDGTRVIQSSDGIQRIKDANNNSIKIYTDDNGTHYQDEQTGREIRYAYDPAGAGGQGQGQVWYQTAGGGWQQIDINFGIAHVRGKIYETNSWNPYLPGETGGGSPCRAHAGLQEQLPVVREIIFPQTEPGVPARRFTFGYTSDTTETISSQARWFCWIPPETYTRVASRGMGALSRMVTPTGATVDYTYTLATQHDFVGLLDGPDNMVRETLTTKVLTHDGVADTWTYDIENHEYNTLSVATNPDGSSVREQFYPMNPNHSRAIGGSGGLSGLVYRTTQSGRVITERRWRVDAIAAAGSIEATGADPRVEAEYTTLLDTGGSAVKMSAKTFQYDVNGNQTQVIEYDWFNPALVTRDSVDVPTSVPAGATVLRVTNTSYHNSAIPYGNRVLVSGTPLFLRAVQETTVGESRTRLSYDRQAYGTAPTIGNLTNVANWDNINSRWLNTSHEYGAYGNRISTTDPRNNVTHFHFDDATHALPNRVVVDPLNGTGQQTTETVYDYSTGLVTSQTDPNNRVTTIDYTNQLLGTVDPFGRPGVVIGPAVTVGSTPQQRRVRTIYEDNARRVTVESDLNAGDDRLLKSRTTQDQLNRTILAEQSENGSTYTISAQTVYEQMGRITFTSNPRRSTSAPSDGWTRATNDTLGRVIEVATFSGAAQPPSSGTNPNWTGSVTTSYNAHQTTVTDQANKQRRSEVDGLGRLVKVSEDPSGLNYQTSYTYDVLNNLRTVTQGVQTRTFVYDSLSRLTSATNPESGTISYMYDDNGNLTRKTDARGVRVDYAYDGFNRVTFRDYFDSTPDVTYTYDAAGVTNSKGRLTSVSSSVSVTNYGGYDALGRVTGSSQVTDGQSYALSYGYDLAGNLTRQTYPSGRIVQTGYDAAGRISRVEVPSVKVYAEQFSHTAHGAVSALKLGNLLWEHTNFNSRLQPVQLGLGTTQGGIERLRLLYDYGTTANNGNVQSQTITVLGMPSPLTQTYSYDQMNRLLVAQENDGSSWKQTFTYADQGGDSRYGNRRFDLDNTTPNVRPIYNPTIASANNRISAGQGYGYDGAGNVTSAPAGWVYGYDGENRQVSANDGQPFGVSTYGYDGEGRRVKKVTSSGANTTIFVYNVQGQLIAEYVNTTPQSGGTSYLTSDTLGSPRIITDGSGGVKARHDYLPFGEELFAGTGGRTTQQGYSVADGVRQQFTGKERDNETGLDYFLARYYSSTQGRFTGVDPFNIVVEKEKGEDEEERARILQSYLRQPQNWNRYAYTRNSPLTYTDPNGQCSAPSGLSKGNVGICIEAFIASATINVIGRGDNRDFAANDPSLTSRVQVSGTISRSDFAWNTDLKPTAGRSSVLVEGIGLKGQAILSGSQKVDKDGNLHLSLQITGINGLKFLPGAPQGDIKININLMVTPDGKVGIAPNSTSTNYPSIGVYSYNLGKDGKPSPNVIIELKETTPAALKPPLVRIPEVRPSRCPDSPGCQQR